jgi:hypothetical protein
MARVTNGTTKAVCRRALAAMRALRYFRRMMGNRPDSAQALRATGIFLAGAAGLFASLLLYCKMHGLWGETVPLIVSARWAASGTLCWSALMLVGWANRGRLRAIAAGSFGSQIRLFLVGAILALATDFVAMQLAGMISNENGPLADSLERAFSFAPVAAMLSAIFMLSLILWNRRATVVGPRTSTVSQIDWLEFPEAPLLKLRAEEVRLIRSAGNYSEIVGAGRSWLVRAPIGDLAARLLPRGFVRVHRQIVINSRHVRAVCRDARGRPAITLSGGETVTVGRSYRDRLDRLTRA